MSNGLKRGEIIRIVKQYIGVASGYLGDFTYASHSDFYPEYCDLDLDPFDYLKEGTTRYRFEAILEAVPPADQAKIIRGVLAKYPVGSSDLRTEESATALVEMAERLERGGMVAGAPPIYTSAVVIRALDDAQSLLDRGGATSAVDRLHTALQGHLQYLCDEVGIAYDREDTMVALLKKLRADHPQLQDLGPRPDDIRKVLNSFASVLDSLNPVRNKASVAHPNEELLDPAEAQLVVNAVRTLLTYLDAKLANPGVDANGDIIFKPAGG